MHVATAACVPSTAQPLTQHGAMHEGSLGCIPSEGKKWHVAAGARQTGTSGGLSYWISAHGSVHMYPSQASQGVSVSTFICVYIHSLRPLTVTSGLHTVYA